MCLLGVPLPSVSATEACGLLMQWEMVGGGRCCCLVAGAVVGGGGAHEVGESMTYRAGLSSWELTHLFCQLVQMRSVAPMVTDVVGDG